MAFLMLAWLLFGLLLCFLLAPFLAYKKTYLLLTKQEIKSVLDKKNKIRKLLTHALQSFLVFILFLLFLPITGFVLWISFFSVFIKLFNRPEYQ